MVRKETKFVVETKYVLYIHIHFKENYAINRIYGKTFRSDLSSCLPEERYQYLAK